MTTPSVHRSPLATLFVALGIAAASTYGGLTVTAAGMPASRVQGRGPVQNPACALLTPAEIRTLTGFPGYQTPSPGDAPGEGVGGGASCQYSKPVFPVIDASGKPVPPGKGPLLSIVLIEGKDYTRAARLGQGCTKESVTGVGDEAHFVVCASSRVPRTAPLYVKAGSRDLIVQLDIEPPDTDAALRPKTIAIARAAAAKLR